MPDLILETVIVGPIQSNCYVLAAGHGKKAVIIDPGDDEKKIRSALDRHNLRAGLVALTHGHYDHIGCAGKFGVPVYIHQDDRDFLSDPSLNLSGFFAYPYSLYKDIHILNDGDIIDLDGIQLEVIHVPGHTPGGIALWVKSPERKILFSGDSLFFGSIGRSDLPGSDGKALVEAIKRRLLVLPEETKVYPGHGPSSTIGEEKIDNPFLT